MELRIPALTRATTAVSELHVVASTPELKILPLPENSRNPNLAPLTVNIWDPVVATFPHRCLLRMPCPTPHVRLSCVIDRWNGCGWGSPQGHRLWQSL
eukprot:3467423-Rhodomonas_salina.4